MRAPTAGSDWTLTSSAGGALAWPAGGVGRGAPEPRYCTIGQPRGLRAPDIAASGWAATPQVTDTPLFAHTAEWPRAALRVDVRGRLALPAPFSHGAGHRLGPATITRHKLRRWHLLRVGGHLQETRRRLVADGDPEAFRELDSRDRLMLGIVAANQRMPSCHTAR